MFYGNGADEGQVPESNVLIVITFFILIKLMVCVDTGSFMCRGFERYLKVKPIMHLRISSKLPISDVQKAFSSMFPFLKIEFFKGLGTHHLLPGDHNITEAQKKITEGSIEVTAEMKVRELEQALDKLFPLHAQVFRRSGNIWLETTMTDDWTLAQQNEHGREISTSDNKKNAIKDDYDLSRDSD